MPKTKELVINTGPLLALIAGVGDLLLLELLYKRVLVSFEVCQEIKAGGASGFGVLVRAKQDGFDFSMREAINQIQILEGWNEYFNS